MSAQQMRGEQKQVATTIPRGAIYAAAGLVALTLAFTGISSLVGYDATPAPDGRPVKSLPLQFEDLADGGILVRNADTGAAIQKLAPGTNGFIRGALRGLVRERRVHQVPLDQPFVLKRWSSGRLSLTDAATGQRIFLGAYGHTNREAFGQFLEAGSAQE